MDKLSRLALYIPGWPGRARALQQEARRKQHEEEERRRKQCLDNITHATLTFLQFLESILNWENPGNSISVVIAFNVLFWGYVVCEVRGFAAASSAALVVALCYSTLDTQTPKSSAKPHTLQSKVEQLQKVIAKVKSGFKSLMNLQQEQPRTFCTAMCTISVGVWVIGNYIDRVFFTYWLVMLVLLGPVFFIQPPHESTSKSFFLNFTKLEWDSEIDEFLPVVTEDNLQVLKRAGETGDRSPTPPSPDPDTPSDQFNDDDLLGLKMPSHDDGSTDGLELSELELSASETEIDGIRFKSGHFQRGSSSSDDDVDLSIEARKHLDVEDDDESDDSEFEIIESCEVDNLKNV